MSDYFEIPVGSRQDSQVGTDNLDAMEADKLMDYWSRSNSVRPIKRARQLFPAMPKGYVRATKDLGNYASNKATAINLRLQGDVERAVYYEAICERIYEGLPDYAKW